MEFKLSIWKLFGKSSFPGASRNLGEVFVSLKLLFLLSFIIGNDIIKMCVIYYRFHFA